MRNENVRKALERAGIGEPSFKQGFPFVVADSKTGIVDLMAHPDRELYELQFYSEKAGKASFKIMLGSTMDEVQVHEMDVESGLSTFSFDDKNITRGKKYYISMTLPDGRTYQIETILH